MANLRLLGGSEGTLLIEDAGRFYPVCDAMFRKSEKQRLAEHVCDRLGLGQVLFVGNKEEKSEIERFACEKWESSCEKCLDAFMVVGGKCSRQKKDKPSAVRTQFLISFFIENILVRVQIRRKIRSRLMYQGALRTAYQVRFTNKVWESEETKARGLVELERLRSK